MTARNIGFITKQIAGHGRREASASAEWTAQMLVARSVECNLSVLFKHIRFDRQGHTGLWYNNSLFPQAEKKDSNE